MKLFVTDYDDTLYTNDPQIKENIKRLKELQDNDFIVMISTGRSYPSIKTQINLYQIPYDFISCADGSIIYDKDGQVFWTEYMDTSIIKDFQKFYEKLSFEEIQFSYEEGYLNYLKDKLLGINICLSSTIYSNKIKSDFYKLKNKYPHYNYLAYRHPNFSYLCIKPENISKSYAISILIDKLNIKKDDVFVIGDSSNDYEMLRDFNGVRMTNSKEEIQKTIKIHYDEVSGYIEEILKQE